MEIPSNLPSTSPNITIPLDQFLDSIPDSRPLLHGKRFKKFIPKMRDRKIGIVRILAAMRRKSTKNRARKRRSKAIRITKRNSLEVCPDKGNRGNYSANKLLSISSQGSDDSFSESTSPGDVDEIIGSEDPSLSRLNLSANQLW
jgi:ribosomal protein L32